MAEDLNDLKDKNEAKQKGKGSLDLKIEKRIKTWKESYLYNIRDVLQKYFTGLDLLSNSDRVKTISSLIAGKNTYLSEYRH